MSTTTPNLGLVKPELTDAADITAMNTNWDTIDEKLADVAKGEALEEHMVDPTAHTDIREYVDQQIELITDTGIPKLHVYPLPLITATEGQTVFPISLSTFDIITDTVMVQKGQLWLNPNGDYTVEGTNVVLTNGVTEGVTIGIWIFKNVPLGEDGSVSGSVIAPGTIPLDRLAEPVSPNININGKTPDENGTLDLLPSDIHITSGTASLEAGTSALGAGHIYLRYK